MTEAEQEQSLRQALHDDPDDAAARLVFADWLEEHGRPEGRAARADWHRDGKDRGHDRWRVPGPPCPARYWHLLGAVNAHGFLHFAPRTLLFLAVDFVEGTAENAPAAYMVYYFLHNLRGWEASPETNPLDRDLDPAGFAALFPP